MKLSVELVDRIFSFLVSDRETLIICSTVPVLFPIVERHLYYFITIHFDGQRDYHAYDTFGPDHFTRAIAENPRIFHYVRILQINVILYHSYERNPDLLVKRALDQFAATLLRFPALKCIKLTSSKKRLCDWPDIFRAALEDRLNLPTLKELYIEGNQESPCVLIDNRKNIEKLSLSGEFLRATRPCGSNLPQLKSLVLLSAPSYRSLLVEPHIHELRSLKCASSAVRRLPELLGMCSQTLKKLDINLARSYYLSYYYFYSGKISEPIPFPQLPPILPHLAQLTIRATVDVDNNEVESDDERYQRCRGSCLPAAAQIIKSFVPPPRHLILEIEISLARTASDLDEVDFSPLAVLGTASLSIPRIDLYVHTDKMSSADTLTQVLASLEDHVDIMKLVEEGNLVVHPEVTAPEYEKGRF